MQIHHAHNKDHPLRNRYGEDEPRSMGVLESEITGKHPRRSLGKISANSNYGFFKQEKLSPGIDDQNTALKLRHQGGEIKSTAKCYGRTSKKGGARPNSHLRSAGYSVDKVLFQVIPGSKGEEPKHVGKLGIGQPGAGEGQKSQKEPQGLHHS